MGGKTSIGDFGPGAAFETWPNSVAAEKQKGHPAWRSLSGAASSSAFHDAPVLELRSSSSVGLRSCNLDPPPCGIRCGVASRQGGLLPPGGRQATCCQTAYVESPPRFSYGYGYGYRFGYGCGSTDAAGMVATCRQARCRQMAYVQSPPTTEGQKSGSACFWSRPRPS